jgi:hypothetical protein
LRKRSHGGGEAGVALGGGARRGGGVMADGRRSWERGREEKNLGERWRGLSQGWGRLL